MTTPNERMARINALAEEIARARLGKGDTSHLNLKVADLLNEYRMLDLHIMQGGALPDAWIYAAWEAQQAGRGGRPAGPGFTLKPQPDRTEPEFVAPPSRTAERLAEIAQMTGAELNLRIHELTGQLSRADGEERRLGFAMTDGGDRGELEWELRECRKRLAVWLAEANAAFDAGAARVSADRYQCPLCGGVHLKSLHCPTDPQAVHRLGLTREGRVTACQIPAFHGPGGPIMVGGANDKVTCAFCAVPVQK